MTTLDWIEQEKLIVIVRGVPQEQILPLAEALYAGGVRVMEITYSMKEKDDLTARAIRTLCEQMGDRMCIGAGKQVIELEDEVCEKASTLGAVSIFETCDRPWRLCATERKHL